MGNLFGGNKRHKPNPESEKKHASPEPQVEDSDRAMLDLKGQKDQIVRQKRKIQQKLTKDEEAARALVKSGKKEQAMLVLRKKKQHQQLVDTCENHLLKLDDLIEQVEMAKVTKEVVEALASGTQTLKKLQQEIGSADHVAKIMDDTADAVEEMQEISDILAGQGIGADDADAAAELEALWAEQRAAEVLATPVAPVGAAAAPVAEPAAATAAAEPARSPVAA